MWPRQAATWGVAAWTALVARQGAAALALPAVLPALRFPATAQRGVAPQPQALQPHLPAPLLLPLFLPSYDMTVRLWDYAAPEDALVRVRLGLAGWGGPGGPCVVLQPVQASPLCQLSSAWPLQCKPR